MWIPRGYSKYQWFNIMNRSPYYSIHQQTNQWFWESSTDIMCAVQIHFVFELSMVTFFVIRSLKLSGRARIILIPCEVFWNWFITKLCYFYDMDLNSACVTSVSNTWILWFSKRIVLWEFFSDKFEDNFTSG